MSEEKMVKAFVVRILTSNGKNNNSVIDGVYSTSEIAQKKRGELRNHHYYVGVSEEYVPESAVEKETKTVYQVYIKRGGSQDDKVFRTFDSREKALACDDMLHDIAREFGVDIITHIGETQVEV